VNGIQEIPSYMVQGTVAPYSVLNEAAGSEVRAAGAGALVYFFL
jgi:hypothetical protein